MAYWSIYKNKNTSSYDALNLDNILVKILSHRNIEPNDVGYFLNPDHFFDPFSFEGMDKAVKRINKAVESKEKIVIYGDYDVDGVCATSILWSYLYKNLHANVMPFIPSRYTEGYGLNENKIREFRKDGVSLMISVDCGIRDIENAKLAKEIGLDLIVTDHHLIADNLPKSFVNIHPALGYGNPEICGAAVAFKVVCALNKKLKYNTEEYLDLVALATICDVSKMRGENRAFVKKGLEVINSKKRVGIASLMEVSELDNIDVYHIGFVLGPQINAPGRLFDPIYSLRLISTENREVALSLAHKLNDFNKERQKLTKEGVLDARSKLKNESFLNFVFSDKWSEGIVGLIAGRLTEESGKPSIAMTLSENGIYIGSARSIEGFNIVDLLDRNKDLLLKYGGHEAAAGLQVREENILELKNNLKKTAKELFLGKIQEKIIKIDLELQFSDITLSLFHKIDLLKPFGVGNPQPVFVIYGVYVMYVVNIGNKDSFVKMKVTDRSKEKFITAIWFSSPFTTDQIIKFSCIDIVFNLSENLWNNKREIQMKIIDLKPHVF